MSALAQTLPNRASAAAASSSFFACFRRLCARPKSAQPFSGERHKIIAIQLLRLGEATRLHQACTQRVSHGDQPARRLIVFEGVLLLYSRA